MKGDPIFITGTQRSGTTLLRLILNAHSEIAIPEEATFLMPLLNRKHLAQGLSGDSLRLFIDYLTENTQFNLWSYDTSSLMRHLRQRENISLRDLIDEIFISYMKSEGKTRWGDKTPSFFRKIDLLKDLFPKAKFLHIVRDGRDVFDSWRKRDPAMDNAAVTALDWRYKLYQIEKSFARIAKGNKIMVRYEDLLDNPQETVRSICSVIGVDYEPAMLDFYRTSINYIGADHSKLIFMPLDKNNKSKWKKSLSSRELSAFNLVARGCLRKYSYETSPISTWDIPHAIKLLLIGLPKRIFRVINNKRKYIGALRKGSPVEGIHVGKLPERQGKYK